MWKLRFSLFACNIVQENLVSIIIIFSPSELKPEFQQIMQHLLFNTPSLFYSFGLSLGSDSTEVVMTRVLVPLWSESHRCLSFKALIITVFKGLRGF